MQLEMFEIDKRRHGAIWKDGAWQMRNWHGYYQEREGERDAWRYHVAGFGEADCTVYRIDDQGEIGLDVVPVNEDAEILIRGRRYGRGHWSH